ncbi:MAG: YezD family protein [Lachnospiraceae bacterium]|nr:YezD family protein [Lachnospiraceae bacterium]
MEENKSGQSLSKEQLATLNSLLQGMKYGMITIIVQDGKIIQIDKTEKHRL